MVCTPRPTAPALNAEVFAFSESQGVVGRTIENVTLLWVAPWKAYWAFAFETLNPENYGLRG